MTAGATLIRDFVPGDAAGLGELYVRSVEAIGPRDYSAAQVAAWSGSGPSAERLLDLMQDGRMRLVATGGAGDLLAFADLERDGHIHFLYCAPEAAGTGVAASLLAALEARGREIGVVRLFAEASEAARRFFLRQGYDDRGRRDFEVAGVAIHNYAMEKTLA